MLCTQYSTVVQATESQNHPTNTCTATSLLPSQVDRQAHTHTLRIDQQILPFPLLLLLQFFFYTERHYYTSLFSSREIFLLNLHIITCRKWTIDRPFLVLVVFQIFELAIWIQNHFLDESHPIDILVECHIDWVVLVVPCTCVW